MQMSACDGQRDGNTCAAWQKRHRCIAYSGAALARGTHLVLAPVPLSSRTGCSQYHAAGALACARHCSEAAMVTSRCHRDHYWKKMASSTTAGVNSVLHAARQRWTESWPWATCAENMMNFFVRVVSEICTWTDRQTDRQTNGHADGHAHCNTPVLAQPTCRKTTSASRMDSDMVIFSPAVVGR